MRGQHLNVGELVDASVIDEELAELRRQAHGHLQKEKGEAPLQGGGSRNATRTSPEDDTLKATGGISFATALCAWAVSNACPHPTPARI